MLRVIDCQMYEAQPLIGKRRYFVEHGFVSIRGWHFKFKDAETAQAFYEEGIERGRDCLILENDQVIDARVQGAPVAVPFD